MKTILVIPDPHDEPGIPKDRFTWAGRLAVKEQPDTIVCLGDGLSLDSLSSYDKGTVFAEGKRYKHDVDSFKRAMDMFHAPIEKYNKTKARLKKKMYLPRLVWNIGNHEQRIIKAAVSDPRLIETIQISDLGLEERGWEVYPLTEPVNVYGIAFAHYFTSGVYGKPIHGINHARALVAKTYTSTVVGHAHTRSFWEDTNVFGQKMVGIVGGCYFTHKLNYTTEEDRNWPGLIVLRLEQDYIDPEFIHINRVEERYG